MKKTILQGFLTGLMLALSACASTTPNYDSHFGEAMLAARAQQTIDPRAALNPALADGLDGQSAREAINNYYDSFKAPPSTFNVINIGGSIAGGNGQ